MRREKRGEKEKRGDDENEHECRNDASVSSELVKHYISQTHIDLLSPPAPDSLSPSLTFRNELLHVDVVDLTARALRCLPADLGQHFSHPLVLGMSHVLCLDHL